MLHPFSDAENNAGWTTVPVTAFHGTTSFFETFDDASLGNASGHPSAALGHFFTTSPDIARTFCLHEDLIDRAYDTHYGSRSLLDAGWLQRHGNTTSLLPGATILTVDLHPRTFCRMKAIDFAARCDEEDPGSSWDLLREVLLSRGFEALLVCGDTDAVERGALCMEYLADTWIALDRGIITITERKAPTISPSPSENTHEYRRSHDARVNV